MYCITCKTLYEGKKKQTNQKTTNNKTKKKKETDLKTDFKKDLHLNDVLWK